MIREDIDLRVGALRKNTQYKKDIDRRPPLLVKRMGS
jgi:hypothetical protein